MKTTAERKERIAGVLLMALSSGLVCLGQTCWKLSASAGWPFLAAGFCLYVGGALAMISAYKHGELSSLQPMLALNYVLALIIAAAMFGESVSAKQIAGALLITAGVILLGRAKP
jgi:drug/metabolite transporter (DMT)-like permease